MTVLAGQAFAKVNLGLRILDRRPDGFHELRTVYQTISLADRLEVGFAPAAETSVSLHCSDPELETDDNLACRAARELLHRVGATGAVAIDLEKRIPHGAGLGGGSADAAAVLSALEQLLPQRPPAATVQAAAASLGSDVPFFLTGGRAVGVGRGEEVYPLPDFRETWMVLLVPTAPVATADAYRKLAAARGETLTPERKGLILSSFCARFRVSENTVSAADADWANDFEQTVFEGLPALKLLKQRLLDAGAAKALLSGSGSALFGVFGDREQAEAARERFNPDGEAELAGVHVARTVERSECRRSWIKRREQS
jgi:4-diphosphocytidyl-2-C-methyl-D-erythritol kinase